jgi:4-hydroxy-tetrahydrodipicolinate synthase
MRGVWTALVTPFNSSGELDLAAFRKILIDQKEAKVAGVIPCGTTGESPTLTVDEKKTLIRTALDTLKGSGVKVIAGTGSNNTSDTVELSRWASDQGVDGLLVVMPYYNKPTAAGQIAHFTSVADAVRCPIMLYNVPGRTGLGMTAETIAQLAAHPRIRMLKEATANVAFTSEILDALATSGRELMIFSGDDACFLPLLSVGAVGVVSVASNLFPRGMVAIQRAYESGDVREAARLQSLYYPLFRDLFVESNPGPIKAAMAWMGFGDERMRLPMAAMLPAGRRKLEESLLRCRLEKGKPA